MLRREFLIAAGSTALIACGPKIPIPLSKESSKPKETSGFEPGSVWRLNAGPHDDPPLQLKEGELTPPPKLKVLYAIDIGTPEIVNLGQKTKSELEYKFTALKAGTVYKIDKDSGTIHIQDDDKLIWYYEHLDLDPKLDVKQDISLYQTLGTVSFRSVPGGFSTGLHVHLGFLREKDGNFIKQPAEGKKIGTLTIHNGESEYDGTMTDGERVITADKRVCDPNKQNPLPCGKDEKGRAKTNTIRTPIDPFRSLMLRLNYAAC